jgi:hypothetical protein
MDFPEICPDDQTFLSGCTIQFQVFRSVGQTEHKKLSKRLHIYRVASSPTRFILDGAVVCWGSYVSVDSI